MSGKIDSRIPLDKKIMLFGSLHLMFPNVIFQFRNIPNDSGMTKLCHNDEGLDFDLDAINRINIALESVFGDDVVDSIYVGFDFDLRDDWIDRRAVRRRV